MSAGDEEKISAVLATATFDRLLDEFLDQVYDDGSTDGVDSNVKLHITHPLRESKREDLDREETKRSYFLFMANQVMAARSVWQSLSE